ncbi:MAG: aminotransferase class V-fold PLP-dependent enzyme [Rhodothermales bacterium]|nr:aminotransferase class V-fold PLP-dependent enzyme [Rhodothermales bacterium]MBO6780692.1 aminotransferase class V-fold PLP-dependent enzyme [Rhodothermales bacterium]
MLECQRQAFFLPDEHHYLNCAYMAPMARRVEQAGIEGIRMKRVPSGVSPEDFFRTGEAIRREFARLIGSGQPDRVSLIPAASYGLATAARNLRVARGGEILTLREQFPSNIYTWSRLARENGATLIHVEPGPGPGRGRRWNERLLDAIGRDTSVVALPHVHWADGTVFDLETISRRCREVSAALIIDGTQSVGAYPIDVQRIRPDALVCAGYKWLLGPYSLGVAWFGPRFDGGVPLEENWISRKNSEDFAGLVRYRDEYGPLATRYDVGERSNFILAPMLLEALRLLGEWRIDRIQAYCDALSDPIVRAARDLGCEVEDDACRAGHLFGLRLPAGSDAAALKETLARRNVSVSLRGDAVRVSPNVYNTQEDVAALIEGLRVHHGVAA